jgi:hypothetical protein
MTPSQAQTIYESVKETLKLNEKKITDAAPDNFTVFVNVSDVSLSLADNTTPMQSTTRTPLVTTTSSEAAASPSATTILPSKTQTVPTTSPLEATTLVLFSPSTSFKPPEFEKHGINYFN